MPRTIVAIFEHEYRELRPRAPIPALDIRFRRFTSLNTTIRLREGRLTYEESGSLLKFYEEGLHGYTYLEDVHEQ